MNLKKNRFLFLIMLLIGTCSCSDSENEFSSVEGVWTCKEENSMNSNSIESFTVEIDENYKLQQQGEYLHHYL